MASTLPPTSLPDQVPVLAPEDIPRVEDLVTEDDTPVDNLFAERQQRLLVEPLYSSWAEPGRSFLAASNVGFFYAVKKPPLVPDALLSMDVEIPADVWIKSHRSYFLWEYGKPPDVAIEIVSDTRGDEEGYKLQLYARVGVPYYVIWDPRNLLEGGLLRAFVLREKTYLPLEKPWFPAVALGLMTWEGKYGGVEGLWLRWCDEDGRVILTGEERAEQERQRAEQEHQRAEQERQRAEQEHQRAEQEHQRAEQERQRAEQERQRAEQERQRADRLAAQLRALGSEPPD